MSQRVKPIIRLPSDHVTNLITFISLLKFSLGLHSVQVFRGLEQMSTVLKMGITYLSVFLVTTDIKMVSSISHVSQLGSQSAAHALDGLPCQQHTQKW